MKNYIPIHTAIDETIFINLSISLDNGVGTDSADDAIIAIYPITV